MRSVRVFKNGNCSNNNNSHDDDDDGDNDDDDDDNNIHQSVIISIGHACDQIIRRYVSTHVSSILYCSLRPCLGATVDPSRAVRILREGEREKIVKQREKHLFLIIARLYNLMFVF